MQAGQKRIKKTNTGKIYFGVYAWLWIRDFSVFLVVMKHEFSVLTQLENTPTNPRETAERIIRDFDELRDQKNSKWIIYTSHIYTCFKVRGFEKEFWAIFCAFRNWFIVAITSLLRVCGSVGRVTPVCLDEALVWQSACFKDSYIFRRFHTINIFFREGTHVLLQTPLYFWCKCTFTCYI